MNNTSNLNPTTRSEAQARRLLLFFLSTLSIAAIFLAVPARANPVPFDAMKIVGSITAARGADGVRLVSSKKHEGKLETSHPYNTPLVITAVAKTNDTDLRLYFGDKGMIILNWELNQTELRHHDPRTGEQHAVPGQGNIPTNTWVTITWTIDEKGSRVQVNGKERYMLPGDYSGLSGGVAVGTYGGSIVTLKSLNITEGNATKKGGKQGSSGRDDNPKDDPNDNGILVSTPAGDVPVGPATAAAATSDPNAIERPEYRSSAKTLVKSISTINAMTVIVTDDGSEIGKTDQVYATVPGDSRTADESSVVWVRKGEGGEMKISAQEAIRAVKLRYPIWDRGKIELSFGDKYSPKDGGSGGTAFGVLLLSVLEGFDIDPRFAITGDITVDWKDRKIGVVPAKVTGASDNKCSCAAIPEANEADIDDMRLLYGDTALWNIQVFSIGTLQQAAALLRTDRDKQINDAMQAFVDARDLYHKAGKSWTHNADVRKALQKVVDLAPNCISATHLLAVTSGKAPQRLSVPASIAQWESLNYMYDQLFDGNRTVDRFTLPTVATIQERRRLNTLKPIIDQRMVPLLVEFGNFVDLVDQLADGHSTIDPIAAKQHLEALASKRREILGE